MENSQEECKRKAVLSCMYLLLRILLEYHQEKRKTILQIAENLKSKLIKNKNIIFTDSTKVTEWFSIFLVSQEL